MHHSFILSPLVFVAVMTGICWDKKSVPVGFCTRHKMSQDAGPVGAVQRRAFEGQLSAVRLCGAAWVTQMHWVLHHKLIWFSVLSFSKVRFA